MRSAKPPPMSRRTLVSAMGAAPAALAAPRTRHAGDSSQDNVLLDMCAACRAGQARQEHLHRTYGDVEGALMDEVGSDVWRRKSVEDLAHTLNGPRLAAMAAEMHAWPRKRDQFLRRIRRLKSHSVEAVLAKLQVVADSMDAEDKPGEHRVLVSAIADLRILSAT